MKKLFLLVTAVLGLNSCQNDDAKTANSSFAIEPSGADYTVPALTQTVSTNITAGAHWTNDRVWYIDGVVVVTGGTLLIDPGTYIVATPGTEGVLVIGKNAKINAVGGFTSGESCNPIVFTSHNLVDNNATTKALPGDFGGLIILGSAPINTGVTTNVIEGLTDYSPQADLYYGGSDTAHDGGTLRYVRIEFAGRRIGTEDAGNEVNGLTLGAVGNLTDIDHVQVSYGLDDGFEFFGGTVNATHLVAFACDDDSFDFDNGYTGSLTKLVSVANKNTTHSRSNSGTLPDSNGIELDNNATGTAGTPSTLITRPVIRQMSIIGYKTAVDSTNALALENGIHVRRLGQIDIQNSTVTGYKTGIRWETPSLPASSSKSSLSVHAFNKVVLPVGTSLGLGGSVSLATSALPWGTSPYQPFYNEPSFNNLLSGNTGAFATEANWTACWTKFSGFVTVLE